MRYSALLFLFSLFFNPSNAVAETTFERCVNALVSEMPGAAAPTACPTEIDPADVAEARLGYHTNREMLSKAQATLSKLSHSAGSDRKRIAELEQLVAALQADPCASTELDTAGRHQCYDARVASQKALRGEDLLAKMVDKSQLGNRGFTILQGRDANSAGYVFRMEAPEGPSPLQVAATETRTAKLIGSLETQIADLEPVDHLGWGGAVSFVLGGAVVGGVLSASLADGGSTTMQDGRIVDQDPNYANAFGYGAAWGAVGGLVCYGITEGIIAGVNGSRADRRQMLQMQLTPLMAPSGVHGGGAVLGGRF